MQYFGFDRPSFGIKTFGFGSSEFSPLDLFAGGKQGVWYDPSDKSTLFQDIAGTVPVTKDGDPVALMRDKSGNNNHAVQSVSTSRPVYKTDGILHWLAFDGVDDYLKTSNFGLGQPTKLAVGLNINSEASYVVDGLSPFLMGLSFTNSEARVATGGAITLIKVANPDVFGKKVVVSNINDDKSSLYTTSSPIKASGVLNQVGIAGGLTIGVAGDAATWFANVNLYGLIVVNHITDDAEIVPYLSGKSGVTL